MAFVFDTGIIAFCCFFTLHPRRTELVKKELTGLWRHMEVFNGETFLRCFALLLWLGLSTNTRCILRDVFCVLLRLSGKTFGLHYWRAASLCSTSEHLLHAGYSNVFGRKDMTML